MQCLLPIFFLTISSGIKITFIWAGTSTSYKLNYFPHLSFMSWWEIFSFIFNAHSGLFLSSAKLYFYCLTIKQNGFVWSCCTAKGCRTRRHGWQKNCDVTFVFQRLGNSLVIPGAFRQCDHVQDVSAKKTLPCRTAIQCPAIGFITLCALLVAFRTSPGELSQFL